MYDFFFSPILPRPDAWTDIFTVIPVICFGYQCHVNAVPIYACLKRKTLPEFTKSILASIVVVFAAYSIAAIFGYLTFGSAVDADVLASYDSKEPAVLVAIIMYLFKTYTSYPLNFFCARTAIEGNIYEWFFILFEFLLFFCCFFIRLAMILWSVFCTLNMHFLRICIGVTLN